MSDQKLDALFADAARRAGGPPSDALDRIAGALQPSLKPVRPIAPPWLLTAGLVAICAAVGLLGALRAGFNGFDKMSALGRASIFSVLAVFLVLAARKLVSEWIPGSRYRISPAALSFAGCLALMAVFALIFNDYHATHFISAGIICLVTGLLHAAPAALAGWYLLRRGFAVNPRAVGWIGGTVAGLAGVTLLELHCANFELAHILVWHTAVIPVSAAAGALLASYLHQRRLRKV